MISIKVDGGDRLAKALEALPAKVAGKVLREALLEGGERIRARASQLAPRAPGSPDLAENILLGRVRRNADEVASHAEVVGIGVPKRFFYDAMLEFGTRRMPAQPFYRPAMDQEAAGAIQTISAALWAALTRAGATGGRGGSTGGGLT